MSLDRQPMMQVPYGQACELCGLIVRQPHDPPPYGSCRADPDGEHAWIRYTDPLHYAFHESAHAIVAARLAGPEAIRCVRIEGEGAFATLTAVERNTAKSLVVALVGGYGVGLIGQIGDGAGADTAYFRQRLLTWLVGESPAAYFQVPLLGEFGSRLARVVDAAEADFHDVAKRMVDDSAASIERLAVILVPARRLEGPALRRALDEAGVASIQRGEFGPVFERDYAVDLWRRTT